MPVTLGGSAARPRLWQTLDARRTLGLCEVSPFGPTATIWRVTINLNPTPLTTLSR